MKPPPLPWAVRTAPERMILLVSGAFLLFSLFLWACASVLPGVWVCFWRELTGLPCAGCGGTRSLGLVLAGRWADALLMNPGVVLGGFALLLALFYAAAALLGWVSPWRPTWPGWRWASAGALGANWLYLLLVGRV